MEIIIWFPFCWLKHLNFLQIFKQSKLWMSNYEATVNKMFRDDNFHFFYFGLFKSRTCCRKTLVRSMRYGNWNWNCWWLISFIRPIQRCLTLIEQFSEIWNKLKDHMKLFYRNAKNSQFKKIIFYKNNNLFIIY